MFSKIIDSNESKNLLSKYIKFLSDSLQMTLFLMTTFILHFTKLFINILHN